MEKDCEVCKKPFSVFRNPSALIMKMIHMYSVNCHTCNRAYSMKEIMQHEVLCKQSVCSNELCGISLEDVNMPLELDGNSIEAMIENNSQMPKIKFSIMGEEFVSCSKKCKKVTKFAYMLRQNNEQEILRAFESMLRKKARKQASLQKQIGFTSGYR